MRQGRRAPRHPLQTAAFLLTFGTGMFDAISYLGLDRVFTANMTGNIVLLGMGLTTDQDIPVRLAAIALAGFAVGALAAARFLRRQPTGLQVPLRSLVLIGVLAVLTAGSAVAFLVVPEVPRALLVGITAALSAGMGMQAVVAKRFGVPDVSTVVLTMTLTSWMSESRLGGGTGVHSFRRGGAVVLMAAGAAAGGALLLLGDAVALAAAAAVVLVALALMARSHLVARRAAVAGPDATPVPDRQATDGRSPAPAP
ncbi:YoaK family protein [Modestobacter sp. VKM Ac-2985]|uniref:YoaK family protein n=1 Tax=Modestobacter sp. VKM Ac-2985 TaxID=3004139 RepID=UPI0022AB62A3|nr:YoaK family protein [Modestobacter sp. VKM Ac-2985]MCZ2839589.1 YoaK family protein [Modestobacter sp. VKM Ac-2985]